MAKPDQKRRSKHRSQTCFNSLVSLSISLPPTHPDMSTRTTGRRSSCRQAPSLRPGSESLGPGSERRRLWPDFCRFFFWWTSRRGWFGLPFKGSRREMDRLVEFAPRWSSQDRTRGGFGLACPSRSGLSGLVWPNFWPFLGTSRSGDPWGSFISGESHREMDRHLIWGD